MTIKEIQQTQTVHRHKPEAPVLHESIFSSYLILEKVKSMLGRGDSKETILEVIAACEMDGESKSGYLSLMEMASIKAKIDKKFI